MLKSLLLVFLIGLATSCFAQRSDIGRKEEESDYYMARKIRQDEERREQSRKEREKQRKFRNDTPVTQKLSKKERRELEEKINKNNVTIVPSRYQKGRKKMLREMDSKDGKLNTIVKVNKVPQVARDEANFVHRVKSANNPAVRRKIARDAATHSNEVYVVKKNYLLREMARRRLKKLNTPTRKIAFRYTILKRDTQYTATKKRGFVDPKQKVRLGFFRTSERQSLLTKLVPEGRRKRAKRYSRAEAEFWTTGRTPEAEDSTSEPALEEVEEADTAPLEPVD